MVNRLQRNAIRRQEAARRRMEFATRQQEAARRQLEAATRDLELAETQERQANSWLAPVHLWTGRVRGWLGCAVRWFVPAARRAGQPAVPGRQYVLARVQRRRESRWQRVHFNAAILTALTLFVVYVLGSAWMRVWYFAVGVEFSDARVIHCIMPFNFECLRVLYNAAYYY